jgi:hypothetical protein
MYEHERNNLSRPKMVGAVGIGMALAASGPAVAREQSMSRPLCT